jgi:ornithine carbamoyltransferase
MVNKYQTIKGNFSKNNFAKKDSENIKKSKQDFIDLADLSAKYLSEILDLAFALKKNNFKGISKNKTSEILDGKNLAMIFEKTSTRTRVSFEVAMNQLGGRAIIMNSTDTQLNKGESVADTARVLSSYVDAIMIRANSHQTILELAKNSSASVINGLSDFSHPCQIMASLLAIKEKFGEVKNKKLVWLGDQNNVLNSYIQAAIKFDYQLVISSPEEFDFSQAEISKAKKNKAKIEIIADPKEAAKNADVIITDTWFSMGDQAEKNKKEKEKKLKLLMPYQVNKKIMQLAKKNAVFTHCLPAYRGFEVAADVIDSDQSIVFIEAENRLHAQKAILVKLLG